MSAEQSLPVQPSDATIASAADSIPRIKAAVRKAQQSARRQVQYGHRVLSPMEEAEWFNLPMTYHVNPSGIGAVKIVDPNPMRVTIAISAWVPPQVYDDTWHLQVSPYPTLNGDQTVQGWVIARYGPPLVITHRDWPGVVQGAFYCSNTPSNVTICVHAIEVTLGDWPESCRDRR